MHKKAIIIPLLLLFILPFENQAQDVSRLLKEAVFYEAKFNDREALQNYQKILVSHPNHLTALCKSSELYALLGRRQATKEKQIDFYTRAKTFAQRALNVNPRHSEANFVMSYALGRIALVSSGEEKIKIVKDIRAYAEKSIQFDVSNYKAYHIMGRWHYEVSDLNTVERWLMKMAYGSLPKSSLEIAIRNYEKSKQLNPGFLLNYLELAKAYDRKGEEKKPLDLLNTMMKLPPVSSNDITIKAEGKTLLEKLR